MDVEFEEMEEGIVDEVNGAVDVLFHPKDQLEGSSRLVAREGGNIGKLARGFIGDVLARVSVRCVRERRESCGGTMHTLFGSDS